MISLREMVFRTSGLPAGVYLLTTKLFIGVQIFGGFPKFFKHHRIYISKAFRPSGIPASGLLGYD